MPRTIVYPSKLRAEGVLGGDAGTPAAADGYTERLAKLVPAEVLAFFIPAASAYGDEEGALIALLAVGTLATPAYLYATAKSQPEAKKPLVHFYFVATAAFLVWSLGVSPAVADLVGLSDKTGGLILAIGAFTLPLIDRVLGGGATDG
jgi:hypothetical protein